MATNEVSLGLEATQPVQRVRLADHVATQLSEQIVKGGVAPETPLPPEQALASRFGVAKSVIREAMAVLSARGLVTVRHGQGSVVNPTTLWSLHDQMIGLAVESGLTQQHLLEVRRVIEPEIAALAAVRASIAEVQAIREVLDEGAKSRTAEEHALWSMAFHDAVAEASGNQLFALLTTSMGTLIRTRQLRDVQVPERVERVRAEHGAMYEAIHQRDPEAARRAALAHLEEVGAAWTTMQPVRSDLQDGG